LAIVAGFRPNLSSEVVAIGCLAVCCRESHSAVLVAEENRLLVFGGNGSQQRPAKSGGAAGKAGAKASPSANKAAGAKSEADVKPEPRPPSASMYLADLWSLDLESWTWRQLKPKGQVHVVQTQLHFSKADEAIQSTRLQLLVC